jgi:hypothetical protein
MNTVAIDSLNPRFTWHATSDPDPYDQVEYTLLLGTALNAVDTVYSGVDTTYGPIINLSDNSIYYWKVVATDLSGATTENTGGYNSFIINLENDSPSIINLISPDSVVVLTLTPQLYWTVAFDPDPFDSITYEVHWWEAGQDINDSIIVDTNTYVVSSPLSDNSTYSWQVISMDQNGGISHSSNAIFWVDTYPEPPLAFNALSPVDSAEGLAPDVEFVWQKNGDPDPLDNIVYTLVYATDWSDSSTYNFVRGLVDTAIILTLEDNQNYSWLVLAIDNDSLITGSNNNTPMSFIIGTLGIEQNVLLPTAYALHQNYPNPFNPSTTIRYDLPERSYVTLSIYDLLGRKVRTLSNRVEEPGFKSAIWDGTNDQGQQVGAGVYLYQIKAGDYVETKKMVLLR